MGKIEPEHIAPGGNAGFAAGHFIVRRPMQAADPSVTVADMGRFATRPFQPWRATLCGVRDGLGMLTPLGSSSGY